MFTFSCRNFALAILASTLFTLQPVQAGVGAGGGGKGVLCGSHLRTLDLYEAEEIYHLHASRSYRDLDSYLGVYGTALLTHLGFPPDSSGLEAITTDLMAQFRDIPAGTSIPPSADATLPKLPPGCSFVQIAFYEDSKGIIQRDRALWDRLSPRDQAALVLHETIFLRARIGGEATSDDARRLVGLLLSDRKLEPMSEPEWSAPRYIGCNTTGIKPQDHPLFEKFEIYDQVHNGQAGIRVEFSDYGNVGAFALFHTSAFVPGLSIDALLTGKEPRIQAVAHREYSKETWNVEIAVKPMEWDFDWPDKRGLDYDISIEQTTNSTVLPTAHGDCTTSVRAGTFEYVHGQWVRQVKR